MPENQDIRDRIENARVVYQVAVNMIIHEGEIFWSIFNTLVLANSIVLTVNALLMTAESSNIITIEPPANSSIFLIF